MAAYFTRPLEALLLSCPIEASEFLLHSGILHIMLRSICAKMPAFKNSLCQFDERDLTIVAYLTVFARLILLQNLNQLRTPIVYQSIDSVVTELESVALHSNRQMLMQGIVYLLLSYFDNVGFCAAGMWKRKIWCLSLLSNYPAATTNIDGNSCMLDIFSEVINISTDVVSEEVAEEGIKRSNNMANSMLSVDYDDEVVNTEEPIITCLQSLLQGDVVSVTSVHGYTKQKLIEMKQTHNEATFNTIINMIGQDNLNRFI
jgi:hypothetical protein